MYTVTDFSSAFGHIRVLNRTVRSLFPKRKIALPQINWLGTQVAYIEVLYIKPCEV